MPGDPTRQLPYHGCRLIALSNFHPVANSSTAFRVVNSGVPFLSGAGGGWAGGDGRVRANLEEQ